MQKEVAKSLFLLTNDKKIVDKLHQYAEYRINTLRQNLEVASDTREISLLQGQIKELRRFITLRDEVNNAIKDDANG